MPLPLLPIIGGALSLVTEFAPGLIKHFAGDKAGEVAEDVAGVVKKATGKDISKPDELEEAKAILEKDPKLLLDFKTELANIELNREKAYLADRQDARQRDVELRKTGDKNWRANIMLVCAFVAVITISIVLGIMDKLQGPVIGFLTTVGGMFARNIGTAFDFEFGSSRGSQIKTDGMFKRLTGGTGSG